MLHLKKLLMVLIAAFIIGNILPSCSDENASGPSGEGLIGTWKLTKVTVEIGGIEVSQNPNDIGFAITIIIRDDGTFSYSENDEGEISNSSGTWTADENTITVMDGEETEMINYSQKGNKLYFYYTEEDEGTTYVTHEFSRQ